MKIIGLIIIVLVASSIGFIRSKLLTARVKFLEDFINFITYLETEIRFCSDSLYQIINRYNYSDNSLNFLSSCKQGTDNFCDWWIESVDSIKIETGIKDSDKKLLKDFGTGLGVTDIDGQIAHCKVYSSHMNRRLIDAREEQAKKSKLYQILGICAGLTIALLMI